MPTQMPPTTPGVIFVITIIILVAAVFVGMLMLKGAEALAARRELNRERRQHYGVKRFDRPRPSVMLRDDQWSDDDQDVADDAQQDNNATTTDCNDEFDSNTLLFRGQAIALAKMVKAGRVGETNGLHDVFDVKPSSTSPRYQAAREALKAELARLDPPARPTPIAGRVTRATFAEGDDE